MIKIFEIPVCVRVLPIGRIDEKKRKAKLAIIKGKGVFVNYNKKEDLINFNGKPYVRRSFLFVPAKNYTEALADVFAKCVGMNFGGKSAFAKAAWIDKSVAIIEFPFCFMLYEKNGDFVCGNYYTDEVIEKCFVCDYQYKRYCPISLCRINILMNYEEKIKTSKKIIFQNEKYDFLKIGYEFDFPKMESTY